MAQNLHRLRAIYTGATGLPGVSTFYCANNAVPSEMVTARNALGAFYDSLKAFRPGSITITLESSGDDIDGLTGEIVGGWTETNSRVTTGTDVGPFSAGVGAFIRARTSVVRAGRRTRGGFFDCPLAGSAFSLDGTLSGPCVSEFNTSLNTLHNAQGVAWYISAAHRSAKTTPPSPEVPYHQAPIDSWTIVDRASMLRSRRT